MTDIVYTDIVVPFKHYHTLLTISRYAGNNNKIALLLIDSKNGEPIATATVNMVNEHPLPLDHVLIKNYSENEGMTTALVDSGVVDEPYRVLDAGYAVSGVHACELTDKVKRLSYLLDTWWIGHDVR